MIYMQARSYLKHSQVSSSVKQRVASNVDLRLLSHGEMGAVHFGAVGCGETNTQPGREDRRAERCLDNDVDVTSDKGWHIPAQGNAPGTLTPKGWHIRTQGNALGTLGKDHPLIMIRSILKRDAARTEWGILAGISTVSPARARTSWLSMVSSASPSRIWTRLVH